MINNNDNFIEEYLKEVNKFLTEMCKEKITNLEEITEKIFNSKSMLLGKLAECVIKQSFEKYLNEEYHDCECCGKKLRGKAVKKELETMVGKIVIERSYFYCRACKLGVYPMDNKLGLANGNVQYDIQKVETWLSSKLPYEEALETYKRCTGNEISIGHMFQTSNEVSENIGILDICPSAQEIKRKLDKYDQPIVMIAVDGANVPTRPEPSCYRGKRGKGSWMESKGFRIYIIGDDRIEHLISWHQIQKDDELAAILQTIKDAELIPEDNVNLCIIGDGAQWIWNKISTIFPSAKQVLDFYHCSEYIHKVALLQFGSGMEAKEWTEATFARLFHNHIDAVIWGLEKFKPANEQAHQQIKDTIRYLSNNFERINYQAHKNAGFHIGSGAIESANKFIGHVRLKRSGAWWYPSHANNILKLRCASYNGTFDRVWEIFKKQRQT